MLCHLNYKLIPILSFDVDCFINLRQVSILKTNIQYGSNNLGNYAETCLTILCHFLPPNLSLTHQQQSLSIPE